MVESVGKVRKDQRLRSSGIPHIGSPTADLAKPVLEVVFAGDIDPLEEIAVVGLAIFQVVDVEPEAADIEAQDAVFADQDFQAEVVEGLLQVR